MKKIESGKEISDRLRSFLLGGIIFLAIAMRLVGIAWGMPYYNMHPDEGLVFFPAYECASERSFEVHGYYYRPNHVSIKLSTLAYLGIQDLYFAPRGLDDFSANYNSHFALFTTASRVISAFFGVGSVILIYLIGCFFGKNQGLLAALLAAVYPGFIEHSHYITPDMPLLFFLLGVTWAALHYQKNPSVKWLMCMSGFTALAICEKYPGAFGCLIIAVAVISVNYKRISVIIGHGLLAVLFVFLGIMAVSPVLILDHKTVLEVMAGQNAEYHIGGDGLNKPQTFVYYLVNTLNRTGLVLTVTGIYGFLKSFKKKPLPALIVSLLLFYIVPISMIKLHWERYTLPIYAGSVLFGAIGSIYLLEDLKKRFVSKPQGYWALWVLLVLFPFGNLFSSGVAVDGSFLAPDSRVLLRPTFEALGINDSNASLDCNTPIDFGGFYGAWGEYENGDPSKYKWGPAPKYVVTSSGMRDLFLEANQDIYGWIADFYRKLDENYPMILYYPVEKPSFHFIELQNMWYSARSVYRYMFKGAASGCEIRVYQMTP